LVFGLLPLTCVHLLLGAEEFLPSATYSLFPSITTAMVTAGFLFRRFEKREKVNVFVFFWVYPKFWVETPETVEIDLYGFLWAIAEKEVS